MNTKSGLYDSVGFPAVGSDLATGSGKWAEVSHLHYGICKVCEESGGLGAVCGHLRIRGAPIEELLIRVEKALVVHQVSEVCIVKSCRAFGVKRREIVVTPRAGTVGLQGRLE